MALDTGHNFPRKHCRGSIRLRGELFGRNWHVVSGHGREESLSGDRRRTTDKTGWRWMTSHRHEQSDHRCALLRYSSSTYPGIRVDSDAGRRHSWPSSSSSRSNVVPCVSVLDVSGTTTACSVSKNGEHGDRRCGAYRRTCCTSQRSKNHSMNSPATTGDSSCKASAISGCPLATAIAESAHCRKSASHSRADAAATNDGSFANASK